jgi:hypothetical protein
MCVVAVHLLRHKSCALSWPIKLQIHLWTNRKMLSSVEYSSACCRPGAYNSRCMLVILTICATHWISILYPKRSTLYTVWSLSQTWHSGFQPLGTRLESCAPTRGARPRYRIAPHNRIPIASVNVQIFKTKMHFQKLEKFKGRSENSRTCSCS